MKWRVEFDAATAFISGPKAEARRRLAACGDQSPVWVARREAWATSTTVAQRLLDQLEGRNVAATIEDTAQSELDLTETVPANALPSQQGLW